MRQISIVLVFLFLSTFAICQNQQKADSAINAYKKHNSNTKEKFEVARVVANEHTDFSVALEYAKKALAIANNLNDQFLIAQAYEEIGLNERLLGNNEKSFKATLKALKIFEDIGDSSYLAASYAQLGANLVSEERFQDAITMLAKSAELYRDGKNSLSHNFSLVNLGEAYRLANKLDSAIYNFGLALNLNESLKNQIIEGYARGNLGMALRSRGELTQAKTELIKANEILTKLGDPYSVSVYTADLAQISITEGESSLAEDQLLQAFNMAKSEGLKEQIRDFSKMLTNFYESQSDFRKALDFQKVFQVYQDSLVNKANIQQTEQLKANYQIDKREREIDLLNQINAGQRDFNIILGVGIMIFGMLAIVLYQNIRQKNEANGMLAKQQVIVTKREEEKALLLKELNHRVKNNLQMVSSLLSLQENQLQGHPAAEAINAGKSRVEALSLIHQKLYQDDVHTTINIKEYLDQLVSNLLYSFDNPLIPTLNIETIEMDIDTAIPISLIVNELVTNALKYAYNGISNPTLEVGLFEPNGHFLLIVIDNGIGMDTTTPSSNSFGLKLVRSLVQQLEGTLEINSNPGGGTSWQIRLNAAKNEMIN